MTICCCCVCTRQPIYLNLQLRANVSGNEPPADNSNLSESGAVTADRDRDDRRVTDSMTNRHAPIRHVVSVNGEDEDVDDINIHDFTTFEQENLIGSKFVRKLKRSSAPASVDAAADTTVHHNLSSFKSAVRVVLTSEAILEA